MGQPRLISAALGCPERLNAFSVACGAIADEPETIRDSLASVHAGGGFFEGSGSWSRRSAAKETACLTSWRLENVFMSDVRRPGRVRDGRYLDLR
ncbi:MAG: hypothetical protein LBT40_11785 [Deltaproteobacteria bacterium]|jgi:hypothetical protein|nr:hypothetical protein [Deltaproteobacteria bacterium]